MLVVNRISLVCCALFLLISCTAFSQLERNHWFFANGNRVQVSFYNQIPSVSFYKPKGNVKGNTSTSISDPITGDLILFTDGKGVFNKNFEYVENGFDIAPSNAHIPDFNLLVPLPFDSSKYYIISKNLNSEIFYSVVDMSENNGLGKVISKENIIEGSNSAPIIRDYTVVVNSCLTGNWIITVNRNHFIDSFFAYEISASGISKTPVVSALNFGPSQGKGVNLKANKQGNMLHYGGGGKASMLKFNQTTGKVSLAHILPSLPNRVQLYNEFSSDGSKLYFVAFGNQQYQIYQYSGEDFSNVKLIYSARNRSIFDILRAQNNKIYFNVIYDKNNQVYHTLDVINFPDSSAEKCDVQEDALLVNIGTTQITGLPHFTNFVKPSIILNKSKICETEKFNISFSDFSFIDSVFIDFGDTTTTTDTSSKINSSYIYNYDGVKEITATWYRCGFKHVITKKVDVLKKPKAYLPTDTSFCFGKSVYLSPTTTGKILEWSTGDSLAAININKEGNYWVKTILNSCVSYDSIRVKELSPILINLGDGYTVCEHDIDDLVKLDAGKGYSRYKWTPTQDTTQWIIVRQAGDYYVVVEDHRGCKGDDGSKVARLCNFDFHLPNAFTPNGDGLNDIFKPSALGIEDLEFEIYNTWGELIFMTSNPQQGWDGMYKGKPCQQGVYLYKISFKGYSNKLLRNYNFKGNVSLLR